MLDLGHVKAQLTDAHCPNEQLTVSLYHVVGLAVEDVDSVSVSS